MTRKNATCGAECTPRTWKEFFATGSTDFRWVSSLKFMDLSSSFTRKHLSEIASLQDGNRSTGISQYCCCRLRNFACQHLDHPKSLPSRTLLHLTSTLPATGWPNNIYHLVRCQSRQSTKSSRRRTPTSPTPTSTAVKIDTPISWKDGGWVVPAQWRGYHPCVPQWTCTNHGLIHCGSSPRTQSSDNPRKTSTTCFQNHTRWCCRTSRTASKQHSSHLQQSQHDAKPWMSWPSGRTIYRD